MLTFTFAGDEAGDVSLNFTKGASRYFVPVFISTQEPDALRDWLAALRAELDLSEKHEFKFHRMTDGNLRKRVFSALAHADFQAWGLVADKTRLPKIFESTSGATRYMHFVTELLNIIPVELQKGATLIMDEFGSMPDMYAELRRTMTERHMPKVFKRVLVRPSNRESLIQIADLMAGAVMRRDAQNDSEAYDLVARKFKKLEEYRPY